MLLRSGIKYPCFAILALLIASPASADPTTSGISQPPDAPLRCEPIKPIPTETRLNAGKVALGRTLFRDPQLSHDNTISCAPATAGRHRMRSASRTIRKVRDMGP